jgi:PEP-CTERM motif-containing protein
VRRNARLTSERRDPGRNAATHGVKNRSEGDSNDEALATSSQGRHNSYGFIWSSFVDSPIECGIDQSTCCRSRQHESQRAQDPASSVSVIGVPGHCPNSDPEPKVRAEHDFPSSRPWKHQESRISIGYSFARGFIQVPAVRNKEQLTFGRLGVRNMLRKATGCFVLWSVLVPWTAHADSFIIPGGSAVPPPSIASPIVNGGRLIGASGVNVGGTLYDVEFVDANCVEVFGGCDDVSDFAFQSQTDAIAAAHALFDQVWVDGVLGLFDTVPALINGCSESFDELCHAWIPYGTVDSASYQALKGRNSDSEVGDLIIFVDVQIPWKADITNPVTSQENIYAKFQPRAVSVPEPSALLLLGTSLVGLVCIRRLTSKDCDEPSRSRF